MNFHTDVKDWAMEYVGSLFACKGYSPTDEAIVAIIDRDWDDWKRLLVRTGLNADKFLAEEKRHEFKCKVLKGGPGRVFEAFAELAATASKATAKREFDQQTAMASSDCDTCLNHGYAYVPMTNARTGEVNERAHRCSCLKSIQYASLPPLTDEMIRWLHKNRERERQQQAKWLAERGITVTKEQDEKTFNMQWQRLLGEWKTGMFAKVTDEPVTTANGEIIKPKSLDELTAAERQKAADNVAHIMGQVEMFKRKAAQKIVPDPMPANIIPKKDRKPIFVD